MARGYQQEAHFIEQQVKVISKPFQLDDKLLRILDQYSHDRSRIDEEELNEVLQTVNNKLAKHYHRYFSKQAIAQVSDQLLQLKQEEQERKRENLSHLTKLDCPVNLQANYQLFSLEALIEQVELLPELNENIENEQQYNLKREELITKVNKIRQLQKNTETVKKYKELIRLKIGEKENIQRVLPTNKSALRDELARFKIILEKLNSLNPEKRKQLKELLSKSDPNLHALIDD